MNAEREEAFLKREEGFWLLWMLASTVGVLVGVAASLIMFGFQGGGIVGEGSPAALGAVVGASTGTAQWLVLQRKVPQSGWWVLASTVGLAVGIAVVPVVLDAVKDGLVYGMVVAGASIGLAQWLVLRWKVSRAGWWVLASLMGFAVTFYAVGVGGDVGQPGGEAAVLAALGFVSYGAITGGALVWLLRQAVAAEPRPPQDAA